MSSAWIGLLGIVAGAVLTGVLTLGRDWTHAKSRARIGALMVESDMTIMRNRIATAIKGGAWMVEPFGTRAFTEYRDDLVPRLSTDETRILTYATRSIDLIEAVVTPRIKPEDLVSVLTPGDEPIYQSTVDRIDEATVVLLVVIARLEPRKIHIKWTWPPKIRRTPT